MLEKSRTTRRSWKSTRTYNGAQRRFWNGINFRSKKILGKNLSRIWFSEKWTAIFAAAFVKRPVRLGVRTQDFHSCNTGSIPVRATEASSTRGGFFVAIVRWERQILGQKVKFRIDTMQADEISGANFLLNILKVNHLDGKDFCCRRN